MASQWDWPQTQRSLKHVGYTPVVTGSMRNRLRPQGIEAPRGAYDGGSEACPDVPRDPPPPGVFVRADSKGVTGGRDARVSKQAVSKCAESRRCEAFVRADSKGLMRTFCL